jgi:DNA replication and repair protein RecF
VHFSPNDIELLSGGPAGRRRFLDVSISQVDPNYVRDLVDYGRVLSQRNALLRELRERRGTIESLGFWNEKLIELGQRLVEVRRSFVEVLNRESSRAYCELSGSDEVLATEYLIADGRSLSLLNEVQKQEIERGQTLVGPHRDDLNIVVNEQPVEAFASRGQQRLVVLSLRLAEVKWLSNESNDVPVLLLDDIFSELDPEHREAVIYRIPKQAQVFITAADDAQVPVHFGRHAAILRISEGNADWESQSS